MGENLTWLTHNVTKEDRSKIKQQKPCLLWVTGLSGSGKSTIANALESFLNEKKYHTFLLDGDNLRYGLNKDLGFTQAERTENIRRTGEVAKLFTEAGIIVIVSLISPYRADRQSVRELFQDGEFIEIYLSTPLEICEKRDPKGLYKKARVGEIPNFTGISSPYESPIKPEINLDTSKQTIEESIKKLCSYLYEKEIIQS
ncbi:adenylyl-sulfate kinase [Leptospira yasudae]|uniref:adenylyl-sulfate kinase n=1 Tax=Leptospira yasudae TaxID=2202201 RepID=UPI000E599C2E|nr:adenylyl-sulfate kinase [Leptospira yasudae]RHX91175.1 adenylyl-sulfate kinase [Leptospira yasudae]